MIIRCGRNLAGTADFYGTTSEEYVTDAVAAVRNWGGSIPAAFYQAAAEHGRDYVDWFLSYRPAFLALLYAYPNITQLSYAQRLQRLFAAWQLTARYAGYMPHAYASELCGAFCVLALRQRHRAVSVTLDLPPSAVYEKIPAEHIWLMWNRVIYGRPADQQQLEMLQALERVCGEADMLLSKAPPSRACPSIAITLHSANPLRPVATVTTGSDVVQIFTES